MTDAIIGAAELRAALAAAVEPSFNAISIDTDMSTSDTVVALASNAVALPPGAGFAAALARVCADLAGDVVRNGEGVAHVIRVRVARAPGAGTARAVGKAIVNSPLFKCAVAGNDPNVGRLVAAVGKALAAAGAEGARVDPARVRLAMGGRTIFDKGAFALDAEAEAALVAHMRAAQLWESAPTVAEGAEPRRAGAGHAYAAGDVSFATPVSWPPHERCVEVEVDLGVEGGAAATVLGADLTHEYVAENADYRS